MINLEDDIKFVIWGTGERCSILMNTIKVNNIVSFIDSDIDKQGTYFEGKPVISLKEYMEKFSNYYIIITPVDEEPIIMELESNNIKSYFRMSMCPSEIQGYGIYDIWSYIDKKVERNGNYLIVGLNLYAYLLYCYLIQYSEIQIFYEMNEKEYAYELKEKLNCNITNKVKELNNKKVLVATRENWKLERYFKDLQKNFLFDLSDIIDVYRNKDILKYKDLHKGEKCFIVATGPSLREDDLRVLNSKGIICFGVNRVFNVPSSVWKPQYYLFNDRKGMKDFWQQIVNYNADVKFLGDAFEKVNMVDNHVNVHKIHSVTGDAYDVLPNFSTDISRKVYLHATVTYSAIQIAAYMGFTEIYLIGVDCNYVREGKNNYFFVDKADKVKHYENRMIMAYKSARKYADANNIKIWNATRGGHLEEFDRVDFDTIMNDWEKDNS